MSDLKLLRDERPIDGQVLVVMPFGKKVLRDGKEFDFDLHYKDLEQVIQAAGFTAVRADSIYSSDSLFGVVWRALQQAQIVIVDFTAKSPNVALEFGLALLIGKKMIFLTQDAEDIPADVRGRLRHIRYSDLHKDMTEMTGQLREQLLAIREEPWVEMALVPMMVSGGADPVPATVVIVTKDFAVIEASGGRRGVLSNADVDYQRIIADMTRIYAVGDRVTGAFEVDTGGGTKYTLLAGVPNPWPRLRSDCSAGRQLTGTVRRVKDGLGAFVDVGYGVEGLVHVSTLGGRTLAIGDRVAVTVTRMDPDRRRLSLQLDRALSVRPGAGSGQRSDALARPGPKLAGPGARFRTGQRLEAEVRRVVRLDSGGYLLVDVAGRVKPAMLHSSVMTPELHHDLLSGDVEEGEILDVEVVSVDEGRDRLCVRDLPDLEDGPDTADVERSTDHGPSRLPDEASDPLAS